MHRSIGTLVNWLTIVLLRGLAILFGGTSVIALVSALNSPGHEIVVAWAVGFLMTAVALWYASLSPARQARALEQAKANESLSQCQCCDFFVIAEPKVGAPCRVCGWRQTAAGLLEPDQASDANNGLTLCQARANILKYQVSSPEQRATVIPISQREKFRYVQRS